MLLQVFGKAADQTSYEVMLKISQVRTRNDTPKTPIKMNKVTISGL